MRLSFALALISLIAFSACKPSNTANSNAANANAKTVNVEPPKPIAPTTGPEPGFKSCNPYFPLVPGGRLRYLLTYSSGLLADATVVIDRLEENGKKLLLERTQIVDRSGGLQINQDTERHFECDGDRIKVLTETVKSIVSNSESSSQSNYRENSIFFPETSALSTKGFTWTYVFHPTYASPGNPTSTSAEPIIVKLEIQGEADVTVPAGTFKAIKIQRKVNQNVSWDYVVKGIGLVKREAQEGTKWELREYSGLNQSN
ncbi:MAG TPA: hypothetical protein VKM94_00880 [Blastocatellia bacterium]|nr:hypothetical protein [Blastocatellia bacterium]